MHLFCKIRYNERVLSRKTIAVLTILAVFLGLGGFFYYLFSSSQARPAFFSLFTAQTELREYTPPQGLRVEVINEHPQLELALTNTDKLDALSDVFPQLFNGEVRQLRSS